MPIRVSKANSEFYLQRVGNIVQREGTGEVINKLEIDRTAFNPVSRLPVLFGSSLKGAIRTALLDARNAGQPLAHQQDKNIELQRRLSGSSQTGKFALRPLSSL